MPASTLVIKVTAGKEEPERCGQALNVAATALAGGVAVSLWLTGESAWFALPGRVDEVKLDHSPPLGDLFGSVLAGVTRTVWPPWAARRYINPEDVARGGRVQGVPTVGHAGV